MVEIISWPEENISMCTVRDVKNVLRGATGVAASRCCFEPYVAHMHGKNVEFGHLIPGIFCFWREICDMIKRNESDVGHIVFEILAKTVFKFLCFILLSA